MKWIKYIAVITIVGALSVACNQGDDDKIEETNSVSQEQAGESNASEDETQDTSLETDTNETPDDDPLDEVEEVTPVEDVYESASEPIDFDTSLIEELESELITDEVLVTEFSDYVRAFYFNYYFKIGLEENGNVGLDAMTLFAVSYIMQNEYNELKFDATTYTLYIPEDHVIHIVQKYFYKQLDVFKSYNDINIGYVDNEFSVVVPNGDWEEVFKINRVEKVGDFTYKIVCDIYLADGVTLFEQVEAIVDESENGPVLINYKIIKSEE